MPVDAKEILSVLLELRTASLQTTDDPRATMIKYDMLFLGEKFNTIYSVELRHSLEKVFGINISIEELHQVLPSLCSTLGMNCEPMKAINDLSNPVPAAYSITLHS